MNSKYILPVLGAFGWISFSEFMRNQFFFKDLWEAHYQSIEVYHPLIQ